MSECICMTLSICQIYHKMVKALLRKRTKAENMELRYHAP